MLGVLQSSFTCHFWIKWLEVDKMEKVHFLKKRKIFTIMLQTEIPPFLCIPLY